MSSVRTVDFYSSCVSLNRLCLLPEMAKVWPAYEKWSYEKGGISRLQRTLGDLKLNVYHSEDPEVIEDPCFEQEQRFGPIMECIDLAKYDHITTQKEDENGNFKHYQRNTKMKFNAEFIPLMSI